MSTRRAAAGPPAARGQDGRTQDGEDRPPTRLPPVHDNPRIMTTIMKVFFFSLHKWPKFTEKYTVFIEFSVWDYAFPVSNSSS